MTLKLQFKEEDFNSFRDFEKAVVKQLGPTTYVGTDSLCYYLEYPKELKARLRPFPDNNQLEFEVFSSK